MQKFFAVLVQGIGILVALMAFSSFSAYGTASLLGCPLNEGSSNSCMLFGDDIGSRLYEEGLMFLYVFAGLPLWGALVFALGLFWSRKAHKRNPLPMPKWAAWILILVGGFFVAAILLVPITEIPTAPSFSAWWPQAQAYVLFNVLILVVSSWWLYSGIRELRE